MNNHDNMNKEEPIDEFLSIDPEEENVKLKLAIRELEAFNFTVSHDLRTPLSNISLCAQAVLKHCGNNLDEQCRTYIMTIFSQTEFMNQLLNSLMESSRASCKEMQSAMPGNIPE